MSAVFDDHKLGMRDESGDFLVLGGRTPTILAANHDQHGTSDRRQERPRVGAIEQRSDLPLMLLGAGAHHHGPKRLHQTAIVGSRLMNHWRQPAIGQRAHALLECEVDQDLPLGLLALLYRVNASVEQGQLRDALGRSAHHFQRDPRTHRVANHNEWALAKSKSGASHLFEAAKLREVADRYAGMRLQCCDLSSPDACIAEETWKKNDLQAETLLRIFFPPEVFSDEKCLGQTVYRRQR